jgi:hypothetical protein
MDLEVAAGVLGLEFDALIVAARIVEGGEHQRLAEQAVIDQVLRNLVIGIDTEIEAGAALPVRAASELECLVGAGIEIMRALRQDRTTLAGDRSRCVIEQHEVGGRRFHQHRRGEVARIAAPCSTTLALPARYFKTAH